ncbi:MAG: cytochrome P450 [Acidimicrobiales bacterium]
MAGNETTTKLLAHAWYWAGATRRAGQGHADHGRIPAWVEETLRYDTSSQLLARVTTQDVELHGQVVPKGDRIVLLAGSANNDERAFPAPIASTSTGTGDRRHRQLRRRPPLLHGRLLAASRARWCSRADERVRSYDIDPAGTERVTRSTCAASPTSHDGGGADAPVRAPPDVAPPS